MSITNRRETITPAVKRFTHPEKAVDTFMF